MTSWDKEFIFLGCPFYVNIAQEKQKPNAYFYIETHTRVTRGKGNSQEYLEFSHDSSKMFSCL